MDKVTQQNAANAEESASASEELSAQAEQMGGIVDELASLVGGSATQKTTTRSTAHHSTTVHTPQGLSKSDHAFHQIASGTKKKAKTKVTAKAIPLDDSDDLTEFNS